LQLIMAAAMMDPQMWQQMMGGDPMMMGMGGMGGGKGASMGATMPGAMSPGMGAMGGAGGGKGAMSNAQMTCSRHGKTRSARNLTDDGAGGMCCAPGFECQVGAPQAGAMGGGAQKKTKLCMYFQMGTCTKGPGCTFAHGEWELGAQAAPVATAAAIAGSADCSVHGKKRSLRNLMDDGAGGMCCQPGFECQGASSGGGKGGKGGFDMDTMWNMAASLAASMMMGGKGGMGGFKGGGKGPGGMPMDGPVKKTKICMYWEAGTCTKGSACSFAHGQEEIGNLFDPSLIPGAGKGMMPGDWTCPACGDHQFARNLQCRKCGADNPQLAGMSGKGNRSAPY